MPQNGALVHTNQNRNSSPAAVAHNGPSAADFRSGVDARLTATVAVAPPGFARASLDLAAYMVHRVEHYAPRLSPTGAAWLLRLEADLAAAVERSEGIPYEVLDIASAAAIEAHAYAYVLLERDPTDTFLARRKLALVEASADVAEAA